MVPTTYLRCCYDLLLYLRTSYLQISLPDVTWLEPFRLLRCWPHMPSVLRLVLDMKYPEFFLAI